MSSSRSISGSDYTDSNFDDIQNPNYNFTGNIDQHGLRNSYGCQTWDGPYQHKYAGNFLYNNMHDKGFYFIRQENSFSFFDGQFYNNKLEGYGQVIHDDGSIYEGLFKDNKKFGPGIKTYEDGTQDVGFWDGNGLLRLSISTSSDFIPTLCSSNFSKVKLLRFKKIVPALPEKKDQAKSMMLNLGMDDKFLGKYPELYNHHVRNKNSSFFDHRYYDLAQLGSEVASIDVLEDNSLDTLNNDNIETEYDVTCTCTNQRCVELNRQIEEINFELKKIHNAVISLKKQQQSCIKCCSIEELENELSVVDNYRKTVSQINSETESVLLSKTILEPSEFSPTYQVEKDLNQMRLETSLVDLTEMNEVPVYESDLKGDNAKQLCDHEAQGYNQPIKENALKENDKIKLEKSMCECTEKQVLDIDFIISELEVLEKNKKFFEVVLKYLNSVLYKEILSATKVDKPKTTEIPVEQLLTWNNNKNLIDILHHCFRYRNFEQMLSFSIRSLLIGDRTVFGEIGKLENFCVNYLNHCGLNQLSEVRQDLMKHNINPDLSDARGNTGVHFAVTNDCHKVIQQLANLGANLDAFNDECLTPLLLAILRYIAMINGVPIWENAFLPEVVLNPEELEEVIQWRPHESLVNLKNFLDSSYYLLGSERQVTRKYSFDEISIRSKLHTQSRKSSSSAAKINSTYLFSTQFIDDYARYKKGTSTRKVNEVDAKQVQSIKSTISTLLHFGANPNVGEVPMCPLLLAIFTNNVTVVEMLLQNEANPDTVNEEQLSALHILASLPFNLNNVLISETFLKYSCDPNTKTKSDYWMEQNDEIIGDNFNSGDDEDIVQGKTPLQLICMRKDFDDENIEHQCTLVRTLIKYGAIYDHFYLGHTLLSIAVLRENVKLVETLYPYVAGNIPLGENMGNALTLLGLNRFSSAKSFVNSRKTIDKLISLGMNPFDPVYSFANVFEFFSNEYSEENIENNKKIRVRLETEQKKLEKNFESHQVMKNSNKISVAYMRQIGRKILSIIYQHKALICLLMLAEEDNLNNNHAKDMAKFLTIEDAVKCMQILIHHENIIFDVPLKKFFLKILEFIKNNPPKLKGKKKRKMSKVSSNLHIEIEKLDNIEAQISNQMAAYILDTNPEKYDVCSHCLKKSKKHLLPCPSCGIVKFCSDMCNKFNKKLRSKHPCNILFYNRMGGNKSQYKFFETLHFSTISQARALRDQINLTKCIQKNADDEKTESNSSKTMSKLKKMGSESFSERQISFSTEEIDQEVDNKMKDSSCCSKRNSILQLCDENEYSGSRKLICEFLCGKVIPVIQSDEAKEIECEKQFCVCYSSYRETSATQELQDQENSEGIMKEKLLKNKHERVKELTEEDIIGDNYDKSLGRFMKKAHKDSRLKNDQLKDDKTEITKIKKYEKLEDSQKIKAENLESLENKLKLKSKNIENPSEKEKTLNYGKGDSKSIEERETDQQFEDNEELRTDQTNKVEKLKKNIKTNKLELEGGSTKIEKGVNTVTKFLNEKISGAGKVENVGDHAIKSQLLMTRNHNGDRLKHVSPTFSYTIEEKKKYRSNDFINKIKYDGTEKERNLNEVLKRKQFVGAKMRMKDKPERELTNTLDNRKNKVDKITNSHNERMKASQFKMQNEGKLFNHMRRLSAENRKIEPIEEKFRFDRKAKTSNLNAANESNRRQGENYKNTTIGSKLHREKNLQYCLIKKKERKKKIKQTPDIGDDELIDNNELWKEKLGSMISRKENERKIEEWQIQERMNRKRMKENIERETENDENTDTWIKLHGKTYKNKLVKEKARESKKTDQSYKAVGRPNITSRQGTSSYSSKLAKLKKFPKIHQYFLELLAQYFPEFDLNGLLLPFACFIDGQLYYKFIDSFPYYCRTYSTI